MAEDTEKEEGQKEEAAPENNGGGKGTAVVIIVGFLVMILTPLVSYLIVKTTLSPLSAIETGETESKKDNGAPVTMNMDALVVNVSGTKMTRVLRFQPHLVLSESRLEGLLREMQPMVKDRILLAASRRTLNELEGSEGREMLKRDIISEINAIVRPRLSGSVVDVHFSEFLIQ